MDEETRKHVESEARYWEVPRDRWPIANTDLDRGQEVWLFWGDSELYAVPRDSPEGRDGVAHYPAKKGERVLVAHRIGMNEYGPVPERVWVKMHSQLPT